MKLTVFGATGATGQLIVAQALEKGYVVTAMTRNPSTFSLHHDHLHIIKGDIQIPEDVDAAIVGQDAVVSALGPNQRGIVTVCTEGARHMLAAMKRHAVRRIVAISAYGAGTSHHKNLFNLLLWLSVKEKMLDKERMEALIQNSAMDWTLVRPSFLTNGPLTQSYQTAADLRMKITSNISRANVAHFVLDALVAPSTFSQAIAITS